MLLDEEVREREGGRTTRFQALVPARNLEDYPVGARVRTPSGREGEVVKHMAGGSKKDAFPRLVVRFGSKRSDIVCLQPGLLTKI